MAQTGQEIHENRLSGQTIVEQLLRNMQLGQFEMAYSVLLPCIFSIYLHPEDHARLAGVLDLIAADAKRALCARVAEFNRPPGVFGAWRGGQPAKEFKIASKDWVIEFFADSEGAVPPGDVEIHSELNETAQPGYRGTRTTLMDREPSVTPRSLVPGGDTRKLSDRVFAEIRYEDDGGSQLYLVTQNQVRVGRGGGDELMDLALYTNDEVSREHFLLRRDPGTGQFFLVDRSTNGTWIDGKRLQKGVEQALPERARIGVAEVLTLEFQVRS